MKILLLSTFPSENPRHGGQHRISNLINELRKAGHVVQSAGVNGSTEYELTDGFVEYPTTEKLKHFIENPFLMDDWAIGELFSNDNECFNLLVSKINITPDLVIVENPWLFQFALRYCGDLAVKPKIVYSSENIEFQLKHDILVNYMSHDEAKLCSDRVLKSEINALSEADAIFLVSQTDLDWASTKTSKPLLLAANGVAQRLSNDNARQVASNLVGPYRYALFCASAHPPNIYGFYEMFNDGVGFLAPDQRLVVVGKAGETIKLQNQFSKIPGLASVFVDAGCVTDDVLQALIDLSQVIILPITHGGGTNLKTAEAIWSQKNIVATTKAIRGFEQYCEQQGVNVYDDPVKFKRAIVASMNAPLPNLSDQEKLSREHVLWSATLAPFIKYVGSHEEINSYD